MFESKSLLYQSNDWKNKKKSTDIYVFWKHWCLVCEIFCFNAIVKSVSKENMWKGMKDSLASSRISLEFAIVNV